MGVSKSLHEKLLQTSIKEMLLGVPGKAFCSAAHKKHILFIA